MQVYVNNRPHDTSAVNVAELVAELQLPAAGIAAAQGRSLITKAQWADTLLTEGCQLTIIKAARGG